MSLDGFIVAAAALAYAACVLPDPVLPRWTAWLAIVAAVINLAGTTSVLFRTGSFSIEGNLLNTWLPGVATASGTSPSRRPYSGLGTPLSRPGVVGQAESHADSLH